MADCLEVILSRRSYSPRHLREPVPDANQLETIVTAGASAPDHKMLRPFRFVLIPHDKRADLAAAFRAAKLERDPSSSEEELQRAGDKAFRGPMLVALVLRVVRDHPRVSITDQYLSAGAAMENMILAAAALGFGCCLRSGNSATSRKVREALALDAGEDLGGFLLIGTPSQQLPPRRDGPAGLLTIWE